MNSSIVSYLASFDWYQNLLKGASALFGFDTTHLFSFIFFLLICIGVVKVCALIGGLGTYAERKISADLQARQGPNRVGPYGILQFLADGVKMILKEDIMPKNSDKFLYTIAPLLCMVGIFATLAVLPISENFIPTNLNIGIFYVLGVSSLVGLGIFLGGYASNSKWSMLGGMRGASQIISYEIPVTLSILSIVVLAGGLDFNTLVQTQAGSIFSWYVFHNPFTFIGFFVFFIGSLAEANRAPFDLPEAESELVSGYHTEYSGMRFAFFALAEYIEVFVLCGIATSIFLGGYLLPFKLEGAPSVIVNILQAGAFFTKTLLLYYVVIWVRWTFPRLRVDQLMTLCWKYLTPIAMFNLVGCAIWMYAFDGESIVSLVSHAIAAASGGPVGH